MKCSERHSHSGLAKTLQVIGDKWTITLIHNIFQGKNRFGQLQREMKGISPKTLSIRLKELEKEAIISKKIFPEIPLHVEYYLTEKGKSLGKVMQVLDEWGNNL
jgi:DNA-binding HxlR family transcriptional regulator